MVDLYLIDFYDENNFIDLNSYAFNDSINPIKAVIIFDDVGHPIYYREFTSTPVFQVNNTKSDTNVSKALISGYLSSLINYIETISNSKLNEIKSKTSLLRFVFDDDYKIYLAVITNLDSNLDNSFLKIILNHFVKTNKEILAEYNKTNKMKDFPQFTSFLKKFNKSK